MEIRASVMFITQFLNNIIASQTPQGRFIYKLVKATKHDEIEWKRVSSFSDSYRDRYTTNWNGNDIEVEYSAYHTAELDRILGQKPQYYAIIHINDDAIRLSYNSDNAWQHKIMKAIWSQSSRKFKKAERQQKAEEAQHLEPILQKSI